jgi:hypothetical protein
MCSGAILSRLRVLLSQSNVTNGQSASLPRCQAPIWGPRPDLCNCQTVAGLLTWSALSVERMGLSFPTAACPRQLSRSRVRVPRDSWLYLTVSDSRIPQPGGPGPVFISPRNRVARLYHQVLDYIFVASYDSQGYGGGIRTRLRAGSDTECSPEYN